MFKALDFFKFGPSFKQWIKTLYELPVGMVKNNGYIYQRNSAFTEASGKGALSRL